MEEIICGGGKDGPSLTQPQLNRILGFSEPVPVDLGTGKPNAGVSRRTIP